jgi:hypothetical protein
MSMEYAVMAETHEGKTMTLRRGFSSQDDAEDHPVQMALWRRVWVAPVPGTETPKPAPTLPPGPWDWVAAGTADVRGSFHAYLVDATEAAEMDVANIVEGVWTIPASRAKNSTPVAIPLNANMLATITSTENARASRAATSSLRPPC